MIISFDLDDTLIPGTKQFATEKQTIIHRLFGIEKIRLGTIELVKQLRNRKHKIYIYTSSFRPKFYIKFLFYTYGIPIDFVINQQLKVHKINTSKFPPAFNIDLHIDDSIGVKIEGERYNFKTILIEENDNLWVHKILDEVG
jgi:phosphoserine phosphatase